MTSKDIGSAVSEYLSHKRTSIDGNALGILESRYEKKYKLPARENGHITEAFAKKLAELTVYRENEIMLFRAFEKDVNDFLLEGLDTNA